MTLRSVAIWCIALQVGAEYVQSASKFDAQAAQGKWWRKSRYADTTIPLPAEEGDWEVLLGDSVVAQDTAKTMVVDGGKTELSPGDLKERSE